MHSTSPINVLLITIDCLRPDHMSVYGYKRPTTPHLDALANKGVSFTQVISQGPCTEVSFPAMFSSTYPGMFGGFPRLSPQRRLLAEMLREAGYRTVALGSNPHLSPTYGYDRGFEIFDSNLVPWIQSRQNRLLQHLNRFFNVARGLLPYLPASTLTAKAVRFLRRRPAAGPWFLWLHYMDVHEPYCPPRRHAARFQSTEQPKLSNQAIWKKALSRPGEISENERQHLIDLYDAEINFVDEQIGQLLTHLQQLDSLDSTLVIVTADHGEEFGEHGQFSHRFKLYDELLWVPLIMRLPLGKVPRRWARSPDRSPPAGQVVTAQVRLLDLVPTILDLLNVDNGPFEGTSLLPLVEGRDETPRIAISETQPKTGLYSIRQAGWKLILNVDTGMVELYNLQEDPREKANCTKTAPLIASNLEAQLRSHLQRPGAGPASQAEIEVDHLTMDRLRDLGYVE
jgi:arylsulfatase A-like enzyme